MVYRYLFKYPDDIYRLTDGRYISYIEKEVHINREKLCHLLKGEKLCKYDEIKRLVNKCRPGADPLLFFRELSESEVREWRKK